MCEVIRIVGFVHFGNQTSAALNTKDGNKSLALKLKLTFYLPKNDNDLILKLFIFILKLYHVCCYRVVPLC